MEEFIYIIPDIKMSHNAVLYYTKQGKYDKALSALRAIKKYDVEYKQYNDYLDDYENIFNIAVNKLNVWNDNDDLLKLIIELIRRGEDPNARFSYGGTRISLLECALRNKYLDLAIAIVEDSKFKLDEEDRENLAIDVADIFMYNDMDTAITLIKNGILGNRVWDAILGVLYGNTGKELEQEDYEKIVKTALKASKKYNIPLPDFIWNVLLPPETNIQPSARLILQAINLGAKYDAETIEKYPKPEEIEKIIAFAYPEQYPRRIDILPNEGHLLDEQKKQQASFLLHFDRIKNLPLELRLQIFKFI